MIFGKKIRELRDEQGVLQRQLAALLEIDTGNAKPHAEMYSPI